MIKILVDSGSDINKQQAEEMGITVIPIEVRFGDEEYLDGFDLLPKEFYEKLEKCQNLHLTLSVNVAWANLQSKLCSLTTCVGRRQSVHFYQ